MKLPDEMVTAMVRAFMESMVPHRKVDGWLTPRGVDRGLAAALEVALSEGGKVRWWCEVHALADTNVNCQQRHKGRDCGSRLVIPLESKE